MKHYRPPSAETVSPTREEAISDENLVYEACSITSPVETSHQHGTHGASTNQPEEKDAKDSSHTSPLISPPLPKPQSANTSLEDPSSNLYPQPKVNKAASREYDSRPNSNHSMQSFRSSSGAFDKRWPTSPSNDHTSTFLHDFAPFPQETLKNRPSAPEKEEQPRFSKGAFDKLSSTLPATPPPWANPNSPKRSFYTADTGTDSSSAPRNTYYQPRNKQASSSFLNQASVFESYGTATSEHRSSSNNNCKTFPETTAGGSFEATRGAWSVDNPRSSWLRAEGGGNERVPEPIIEEPASPVLSAVRTPLLLGTSFTILPCWFP